jgi:hypothetical protein
MRFFIDLAAKPVTEQTVLNGTPQYLEVQEHGLDPPGISYVYVIPLDASSFVVATCWGHEFDRFREFIFHPKQGPAWIKAYSEPWPTFGELINNALAGNYSRGALVNFEDPDDGERKWYIATFVGNIIPTTSYQKIANDPKVVDACQRVYIKSAELLQQYARGGEISVGTKAKMLAMGAWSGHTQALDTSLVWLNRLDQLTRFMPS